MEAGPEDEGSPANQMRMGNLKKRTEHGHVVQYKARLVDKGFKQKFGVDYFETYSPVANITVKYKSTVEQLVDMLTKTLGTKRLKYLLQASGIGPKNIV